MLFSKKKTEASVPFVHVPFFFMRLHHDTHTHTFHPSGEKLVYSTFWLKVMVTSFTHPLLAV